MASSIKIHISEADAERLADRMVWTRLKHSSAYTTAENGDAQSEAEDAIEREVWAELESSYEID